MPEHPPGTRRRAIRLPLPDGKRFDGLLVRADNQDLLAALPPDSIDLIVADPPFATGRRRTGTAPAAGRPALSFPDPGHDPADYVAFLRPPLEAMHRLLSAQGSIVVHLDYRVVHHLRLELDRIFGRQRFLNEIIWHYTGGGRSQRYFSRKHDTLLWYAKGKRWTFEIDAVRVPYAAGSGYARGGITAPSGKRYHPHPGGTPVDDVWDIPIINPLSPERCGFPTQKPERLLERILCAMSRPGELVLDPFCGSGTTAIVAQRTGRRWIAGDISTEAVQISQRRLVAAGAARRFRLRKLPARDEPRNDGIRS